VSTTNSSWNAAVPDEHPVVVARSRQNPRRVSLGRGLRKRGEDLGLSQAEIARRCGLSPERYGQYVRDEREPDFETLHIICSVLKTTPDRLLGYPVSAEPNISNTPDLPPMVPANGEYVSIPFLEIRPGMGGGGYEDISDSTLALFPRRLIRDQLGAQPEEMRVVEVEGSSMSPMLESGDQVLVHLGKRNPSQPGIFCLWDGFGHVCKWVERIPRTDPARLRIVSANQIVQPYELTEEEAYIIGRVVWFARRL
jgi:transcriptional regulator with XRE-family HTH domain